MITKKERMNELIKILNQANIDYYMKDSPTISDFEYDKLLNELKLLEELHPEFLNPNSPTQKVGGFVSEKFQKVLHKEPLLSLGNAFSFEDLEKFDERIKKEVSNPSYICELKIDGLSIKLEYEKGDLAIASTRGDGSIGENITENIKVIRSIPIRLEKNASAIVRGEAFMPKRSFMRLNEERKKNNEPLFLNTRNASSGTLRQLDTKIVAKRNLDAFFYTLYDSKGFKLQTEVLKYFEELGLKINPLYRLCKNIFEVIEYVKEYEAKKNDLEYDIDGIVIKVNELDSYDRIGYTSKVPKWAIAYKFQAEQAETKILGITFQVGRTGAITPVCELESVLLNGSNIKRATLHNEDYCLQKDIRIGARVLIQKAGEVIPEVAETIKDEEFYNLAKFKMIENCPSCGSSLIKKDAEYFCVNDSCVDKELAGLIHFCGRNTMNIESLGEKILETFYNEGYVKNIFDIFELVNKKDKLIKLPGMGEKSINKIIENIEASKKISLDKIIFALGIKNVGAKVAKILAKNFRSLKKIQEASFEEFNNITDIGSVISQNIVDFFQSNPDLIEKLEAYGVNTLYAGEMVRNDHFFSGKTVVITGTLENFKRNELTERLEILGAKVLGSVSKKLDYLICGKEAGSKLSKAEEFGVKILFEEELGKILNEK